MPNFKKLLMHFSEWAIDNKDSNFNIREFDTAKIVSSLEDGYVFVRTRFLNKGLCQEDVAKKIIEYTYQYAYRDISGLVDMYSPDDETSTINDVESTIQNIMVSDGYARY